MALRSVDPSGVPVDAAPTISRWAFALVALGLILAAGMRIWILSSSLGAVDMDEAVSGLMARQFSHGHFSVFYWGQPYGGSQEAIATAAIFALAGPGRVALKVVPMLSAAGAAWLVWRIGRRTIGERQASIAAVLFLLGPAFFVLRSTKAYGFYGTALVVCCAVLLVVLRLRERTSAVELLWLGVLLGVGWWATPQVVFVVVPAVVWLAARAPASLRRAHLVLLGGVAGSAPWLLWSVTHDWASLRLTVHEPGNTYSSHLGHFLSPLLPQALGLRVPYSGEWLPGRVPGLLAYAILLGGFAYLLWKRPPRLELLLVVAVAYPFLFAVSPASFYTGEPRYLYLLSPVLALLLAGALATPLRQLVGVGVVAVLSIVALDRLQVADPLSPRSKLDPLIAALDSQRVDRVFAPYRIAYRLTFDADERIVASPTDFVRSRPMEDAVRGSPLPGYVLLDGSPDQVRLAAFLAQTGELRDHVQVGVFHVYVPRTKLLPEHWRQ